MLSSSVIMSHISPSIDIIKNLCVFFRYFTEHMPVLNEDLLFSFDSSLIFG